MPETTTPTETHCCCAPWRDKWSSHRDAGGWLVCARCNGRIGAASIAEQAAAFDKRLIDLETRNEALEKALANTKDGLDEAAEWMERIALPALGDNSDGGNALCEVLKHTADEAKDALAGGGA